MTRINLDNIAALQNPYGNYKKSSTDQFKGVMESTEAVVTQNLLSVVAANAGAPSNFVSNLNSALKAYGINVPPVLRVTAGDNGYELSGDPRNTQFKRMLADNPSLAAGFASEIGAATSGRDAALKTAMSAFAGSDPTSSVKRFLKDFEDAQEPKGLSVKFDGQNLKVEELGDKGWGPVKNEESFMTALLEAYAKHMLTQGISTEKDKEEKEPLAEKKTEEKTVAAS